PQLDLAPGAGFEIFRRERVALDDFASCRRFAFGSKLQRSRRAFFYLGELRTFRQERDYTFAIRFREIIKKARALVSHFLEYSKVDIRCFNPFRAFRSEHDYRAFVAL